eukprot:6192864-Pleurochrysis_carterae.AAC.3
MLIHCSRARAHLQRKGAEARAYVHTDAKVVSHADAFVCKARNASLLVEKVQQFLAVDACDVTALPGSGVAKGAALLHASTRRCFLKVSRAAR